MIYVKNSEYKANDLNNKENLIKWRGRSFIFHKNHRYFWRKN
ncbi:hypothetical protein CU016_1940 [Enterococcus lactis]|nr:hypothetical protein [Enterococcus lactis]MBL5015175.1 hypothetical protein [Enterococcus lactis]